MPCFQTAGSLFVYLAETWGYPTGRHHFHLPWREGASEEDVQTERGGLKNNTVFLPTNHFPRRPRERFVWLVNTFVRSQKRTKTKE